MKCKVTIFLAVFCVGCVPYPVYKTLQPRSEVTVMDVDNDPIKNAKVTLISSSYPYRFEKTRETKMTSNDGKAKFESKKEWRIEALMLHGAEIFFWNWCVYKEGFETYRTAKGGDHEFVEEPIIILKQGKSQECPKRLL